MASTLTNLLYHLVFSTKNREPIIVRGIRAELHNYMGGVIKGEGGVCLEIGGTDDHVHLLIKLKPTSSVSDVLKMVKGKSTKWINDQNMLSQTFAWQAGYGAFSVSVSEAVNVARYVRGQEKHHRDFSFQDELLQLLGKHDVEFDQRYL